MTDITPDKLFADNGGAALLAAYGVKGEPTLETFFSTNLPAPIKGDKKRGATRVAGIGSVALLAVWDGGMLVRSSAAPPDDGLPPGIDYGPIAHFTSFPTIARDLMDKPRPLLFLTVGLSYGPDVAAARTTLDPDIIESFGKVPFVLDRDATASVTSMVERRKIRIDQLRKMAFRLAEAVSDPTRRPLHAKNLRKEALRYLGVPEGDGADAALIEFWKELELLPPPTDAAWKAAA